MRLREPEILLWLPLLPIFVVGMLPMLLFAFLGFAGVALLGVLITCVGLGCTLTANSDFNREVIVHGYARPPERAFQTSSLRSAVRFATVMTVTGGGLILAGSAGFLCFG
jgi:hypothetical protein